MQEIEAMIEDYKKKIQSIVAISSGEKISLVNQSAAYVGLLFEILFVFSPVNFDHSDVGGTVRNMPLFVAYKEVMSVRLSIRDTSGWNVVNAKLTLNSHF